MVRNFLVGHFLEEEKLLEAVRALRREGYVLHDVYAPYAIHELDEAMGVRHTRLARVTFFAGTVALFLAFALQYWTSAVNWPINVGGKPYASWLAFLPVGFELMVLVSGLATAAAFFWRCGLFPGRRPYLFAEGMTDDRFAVVLERHDASFDEGKVAKIMREAGVVKIEEKAVVR